MLQQNRVNIALCQCDIEWENPLANISKLDVTVREFMRRHPATDVLVFPEFFSTGFTMNPSTAEEDDGVSATWLRRITNEEGVAVVASVPIKEGEKLYNRCYFITSDGCEHHYHKRHLFNIAGEGGTYTPGSEQTVVDFKGWRIALNVCYDLRFPVWSRNCGNSYDLLINIANWPEKRIEAAKVLSRARAIENASFFAFCNRVGRDTECEYNGCSMLIDFKGFDVGKTITLSGTEFVVATFDMEELLSFRERFPSWRDSDRFEIK